MEASNVAVGALALLSVLGVLRWREAVGAALVLAVFEGAIRKWVIPEAQQYAYFLKDALLIGAYAGYCFHKIRLHEPLIKRHPANIPLVLLAIVALLGVFNPGTPTARVWLFGLKAYFMYVPLLYVVPDAFKDPKRLRAVWAILLFSSVITLLVGVLQFSAPADSELNRYVGDLGDSEEGPAVIGSSSHVRITGTFSYISGYNSYLTFVAIGGVASIFREAGWRRRSIYVLLGLILLNIAMTGSRGPFMVLILAVMILLIAAARHGGLRISPVVAWTILGLPLVVWMARVVFPDLEPALVERFAESEDMTERLFLMFYGPFEAISDAGLFGYGTGTTHQGVMFVMSSSGPIAPEAEGEWQRIVLELGPFGLALSLFARILVAHQLWVAAKESTQEVRPFILAAFAFATVNIPAEIVFNHVTSLFYWFMAGCALLSRRFNGFGTVVIKAERARPGYLKASDMGTPGNLLGR